MNIGMDECSNDRSIFGNEVLRWKHKCLKCTSQLCRHRGIHNGKLFSRFEKGRVGLVIKWRACQQWIHDWNEIGELFDYISCIVLCVITIGGAFRKQGYFIVHESNGDLVGRKSRGFEYKIFQTRFPVHSRWPTITNSFEIRSSQPTKIFCRSRFFFTQHQQTYCMLHMYIFRQRHEPEPTNLLSSFL